jgi:transposase
MVSRETKVDINFLCRQGLSYREISRKTGRDRRTVKCYAENPEVMWRSRAPVERESILDPFKEVIESWLEEDSGLSGDLDIRPAGEATT